MFFLVIQPSSNQGGVVATPLTVFSWSLQNAKERDLAHIGISFTSFVVILMKKKWGYHLTGGRVSRQSQRMRWGGWNLFQFFEILSHHFEKKYMHMKLSLENLFGVQYPL